MTGAISGHVSSRGGFVFRSPSPLFKLACVLVRLDHIARLIIDVDHSIM
jgi:hypothetical protein